MNIPDLVRTSYRVAAQHGFWEEDLYVAPDTIDLDKALAKLMLVTTEVAEAAEELRKNADPRHTYTRESDGKPEGFAFELADAIIRIADLAGACGVDLDRAIATKTTFNMTRPFKHNKLA